MSNNNASLTSQEDQEFYFSSLNLKNLYPKTRSNERKDGGIYLIIGASGSGKSTIALSLFHSKSHFIPITIAISETEVVNQTFANYIPELFVYQKLTTSLIQSILLRQKLAIQQNLENPWLTLIIDDCMNKKSNMSEDIYQELFKTSRQLKMFVIITCQYTLDINPNLRDQCAGYFLLKGENEKTMEKLYENYGSKIPKKQLFYEIMSKMTANNGCVFLDNRSTSDDWRTKIYYFKAEKLRPEYFVSRDVIAYDSDRRDPNLGQVKLDSLLKEISKHSGTRISNVSK